MLARTGAAVLAAWGLLLVVVLLWYASVSRRRVRAGIARERQLTYALMVTLAGVALAVVAGAASTRLESGLMALPGAAGADDARWIAETIWRSRLKIGLFAVALAVFLPAIAYLPISDSTRGILTGLPIVPFGGLVAIAGDAGMSVGRAACDHRRHAARRLARAGGRGVVHPRLLALPGGESEDVVA